MIIFHSFCFKFIQKFFIMLIIFITNIFISQKTIEVFYLDNVKNSNIYSYWYGCNCLLSYPNTLTLIFFIQSDNNRLGKLNGFIIHFVRFFNSIFNLDSLGLSVKCDTYECIYYNFLTLIKCFLYLLVIKAILLVDCNKNIDKITINWVNQPNRTFTNPFWNSWENYFT